MAISVTQLNNSHISFPSGRLLLKTEWSRIFRLSPQSPHFHRNPSATSRCVTRVQAIPQRIHRWVLRSGRRASHSTCEPYAWTSHSVEVQLQGRPRHSHRVCRMIRKVNHHPRLRVWQPPKIYTAANLDEKQHRLTEALMGLHSLTGCFIGKGQVKPITLLEANAVHKHVMALRSLTLATEESVRVWLALDRQRWQTS